MSADDPALKFVFAILDAVETREEGQAVPEREPLIDTGDAIQLVDDWLGPRTAAEEQSESQRRFLQANGYLVRDTAGIKTKGCPDCKGTMYRTEDKTGGAWVCSKCGKVE